MSMNHFITKPLVLRLEAADLSVLFAGLTIEPSRRVLGPMLEHEPYSSLSERRINLLRHDHILSTRKESAPNLGGSSSIAKSIISPADMTERIPAIPESLWIEPLHPISVVSIDLSHL